MTLLVVPKHHQIKIAHSMFACKIIAALLGFMDRILISFVVAVFSMRSFLCKTAPKNSFWGFRIQAGMFVMVGIRQVNKRTLRYREVLALPFVDSLSCLVNFRLRQGRRFFWMKKSKTKRKSSMRNPKWRVRSLQIYFF